MDKTRAFRTSACLITVLILSSVQGMGSTNQLVTTAAEYENAVNLCERLMGNTNDQKAAIEIAAFAKSCPDKKLAGKLVAAYACARLLAGDSAGFTSTLNYLRQNLPDAPGVKLLEESQFTTRCEECDGKGTAPRACQKCNGTGACAFCGGSGVGKGKGFEGQELTCIGCGGKGKCKSCSGTGNTTTQCAACRGRGQVFSKNTAEERLSELLASAKDMAFAQTQIAKGLVRYQEKWVTPAERDRTIKANERAFEQEQTDKGLVKIEDKWVKTAARDSTPPEKEKASPVPRGYSPVGAERAPVPKFELASTREDASGNKSVIEAERLLANGDHNAAVRILQSAAEAGDGRAQYLLGCAYSGGNGVLVDHSLAARWFESSAKQGNADGQTAWGMTLMMGLGVKRNLNEGISSLQRAANAGHLDAIKFLGNVYFDGELAPKDLHEAARWYQKGADKGDADSLHHLGVLYLTNEGLGSRDPEKAFVLCLRAAKLGVAKAQLIVGSLYESGTGTEKDLVEAYAWYYMASQSEKLAETAWRVLETKIGRKEAGKGFGRALELGSAKAHCAAGNAFAEKGEYILARTYFEKSAAQGYAEAEHALGQIYQSGLGTAIDMSTALSFYGKAAGRGFAPAQFRLGALLISRNTSVDDVERGFEWVTKAAMNGDEDAKALIENTFLESAKRGNPKAQDALRRAGLQW